MTDESTRPTSYNLLFVCTGNTCRSPMAAAIARAAVQERGWSHVGVESAGVAALAGSPASDHVLTVLEEKGIELGEHEASELTPERVEWADMILVMGPGHLAAVEAMGGADKAGLITEFLDGEGGGRPVLDPIGGEVEIYRATRDQLAMAVDAVLDRLAPILSP